MKQDLTPSPVNPAAVIPDQPWSTDFERAIYFLPFFTFLDIHDNTTVLDPLKSLVGFSSKDIAILCQLSKLQKELNKHSNYMETEEPFKSLLPKRKELSRTLQNKLTPEKEKIFYQWAFEEYSLSDFENEQEMNESLKKPIKTLRQYGLTKRLFVNLSDQEVTKKIGDFNQRIKILQDQQNKAHLSYKNKK